MILILSPAKKMADAAPEFKPALQKPLYLQHAAAVIEALKELSRAELRQLMGISEKIADENYQRYRMWSEERHRTGEAVPGILAYKGDTYIGLQAETFTNTEIGEAEKRLRILSAVYGVVRPLDAVLPYRLEMQSKLTVGQFRNLCELWRPLITKALNDDLEQQEHKVLINLASNEYFKAIDRKTLKGKVVTPVFKEFKNGTYKVQSLFAKRARGKMAAWIIKNRICQVEDIIAFDEEGYLFNSRLSEEGMPVFTRE